MILKSFIFIGLILTISKTWAQTPPSIDKFSDGIHHWFLEVRNINYKRYATTDYVGIANNLTSYQNPDGGWPKNIDWLGIIDTDSVTAALPERYKQSTFDNRNTHPQIEYLAKAYILCGDEKYKLSAEKGLDYIIATQNPSGGWHGWDVDAITFNDDVMTGIMSLLLDIKTDAEHFNWLNANTRRKATSSLRKALDVTLRCQVTVNGKKTAWGQQHNHRSLAPVKARTYELPGLTANESTSVLHFLMSIPKPNKKTKESIEAGIQWLNRSTLRGIRIDTIEVPPGTYPGLTLTVDRKEIPDSMAGPLWARFYEIETNQPFMCTRQGVKVYSLNDVNPERRAGYAWYGRWPKQLLEEVYPNWRKRVYGK